MIKILSKLNRITKQNLRQNYQQTNNDPNRFESDLKYFQDWFKAREEIQQNKFDYFYGPFSNNSQLINQRRLKSVSRLIRQGDVSNRSLGILDDEIDQIEMKRREFFMDFENQDDD